jgi:AraC-like DNA-binding protein
MLRCLGRGNMTVLFEHAGIARHADCHQIEGWITGFVRTCRQLTGRQLHARSIRLIHHRHGEYREFEAFMGCEIAFGAEADEVAFAEAGDDMRVIGADPHLNRLLTAYCDEALANRRAGRGSLRLTIENAIVPLLPHGKPRAREIARRLAMSNRTLARRLASEGLTFAKLLDDLRYSLATRYLSEPDLSISKVAWLLGYQEVSAFTHAFRRWTGKTPRQARTFGNAAAA